MKKLLVIVILISFVIGCTPEPEVKVPVAEPLTFVIIPSEEATLSREQWGSFVDYLTETMGREIRLFVASDYTAAIEAMKYGWADFARFGPFSYVLATEEANVEAIAVAVKKKSGRPAYNALIVARADSGVTDLNGATFAFVDVASTSGYLAPTTYLKEEGIELGKVFYAGSHSAVIEAIKNRSVQAGAIGDNRYLVALEEGVIAEDEFVIIWESDPIPNSPIAVQKDMDESTKTGLLDAFLNAPIEVIEKCAVGDTGYVEAHDADYDFVRKMAENQ